MTAAELRELVHYDPVTGIFAWLGPNVGPRKRGDRLGGYHNGRGHRLCSINGPNYYLHRLAWLYMTGEWPLAEIDHINNDPSDNRWANLRAATHAENNRNKRADPASVSGIRGVFFDASRRKWEAVVQADGRKWSKRFDTRDEAIAARNAKAREMHGAFAKPASG